MNWLIRLTNKLITHDRDTAGDYGFRVLQHIPIGVITAGMVYVHWSLVLAFTFMFWAYQTSEDLHHKDEAWKDVSGWLIGFCIGSALAAGILLWRRYA